MLEHVYLIPLLPLAAAVTLVFLGKEGPHSKMPFLSVATMGWCLLQSSAILWSAMTGAAHLPYAASMPWFEFGEYPMSLGVLIDGPAAMMLFVVTLVSFLMQVYSIAYMHGDPRFKRYFAYVSFFTASMLGLVVSSNLLVVFSCWELMGVSSYLLIGFWFEKPGPAYASKKAFITTKVGDLGFYLGMLIIFAYAGTFDLTMLRERVAMGAAYLPAHAATAAGLCLLFGAVGKSAQWPLFIWLPDAMEGPTPVSALIHAATMVAAGIYLVARTYFIYQASPLAMDAVAWIGLVTAFMAASMALVSYDIKRVLAFSTVSQLGYMMLALGVGGYSAGLFHLTTHAFFKALLFLGAGSVIHSVHSNDMREMGGLSKKMIVTFATMTIATLAIAGFPFSSGYYSKEAVLGAVYAHSPAMWAAALFTAAMTTFYMFRLIFMTFLGEARDHEKEHHAHESPALMTIPLCVLAVLSVCSGWILEHFGLVEHLFGLPSAVVHGAEHAAKAVEAAGAAAEHGAAAANHAAGHPASHPAFLVPAALSAFAAGLGISWKLYASGDFTTATKIKQTFGPVFTLLEKRYYFDDFFLFLVDLSDRLAAACFWVDANIVDRIFVDGWGLVTILLAEIENFIDAVFVDGLVDASGWVSRQAGAGLRTLVTGQVQEYLLYVALAVSVFIIQMLTMR
ncbi:MAG: NADH-quinone oxidoreductase subunit L [Elusimicrobia bacterium]|nr:NADH-quinone oxidoreductase subunit L [Elusimicrobiota bacterium]